MMAHPVNPARNIEEMRPLRLGNRLVMCSCERWKHIPPAPRMTAPGGKALNALVLEQPRRMSAIMFRVLPAKAKPSIIRYADGAP